MSSIQWRWAARLALTLLALSILPVVLGIVIDVRVHTFPLLTLVTMFFGFNVGIIMILRSVAGMYSRITLPDKPGMFASLDEKSGLSNPIGGDQ